MLNDFCLFFVYVMRYLYLTSFDDKIILLYFVLMKNPIIDSLRIEKIII